MTEMLDRGLLRGSLELMVLSALGDGAKYGYLIQKRLREASGNLVRIEAGTLYPILHKLEADKAVRCRWDATTGRKRKWYELTAAGRRRLANQAAQWRRYAACMESVIGDAAGGLGLEA